MTAETLARSIRLTDLKPGIQAGIVSTDCGEEISHRLEELGFVPGNSIEVLGPGFPLRVRVGDSRVCLRQAQALGVRVIPL